MTNEKQEEPRLVVTSTGVGDFYHYEYPIESLRKPGTSTTPGPVERINEPLLMLWFVAWVAHPFVGLFLLAWSEDNKDSSAPFWVFVVYFAFLFIAPRFMR